jgi:hypothetical protein
MQKTCREVAVLKIEMTKITLEEELMQLWMLVKLLVGGKIGRLNNTLEDLSSNRNEL